jgi:hypothetical protein
VKAKIFGLFLISMFVLFYEILMFKIVFFISQTIFALQVFPISLLGLGIGGLFTRYFKTKNYFLLSLILGLIVVPSIIIVVYTPLTPLTYYNILIYWFFLSLPFILCGMIISLFFVYDKNTNTIYFLNLLGSAFGILLGIFVLQKFNAETAVFIASFIAFLSALFFSKKIILRCLTILLIVIFLFSAYLNFLYNFFDIAKMHVLISSLEGPYTKNIFSILRKYPNSSLLTTWNFIYRTDIVNINYIEYIPVFSNGNFISYIQNKTIPIEDWSIAPTDIFPYLILHNKNTVLIIGTGGGKQISIAEYFNFTRIIGVEINVDLINMIKTHFSGYSNAYSKSKQKEIVTLDGRSFIESSNEKFDLIQLPFPDTAFFPVSNTNTLGEDYLYTKEAFQSFFSHLSDNGILAVERFLFFPQLKVTGIYDNVPELLKYDSIVLESLNQSGINPKNHIVILGYEALFPESSLKTFYGLILIKKTEFSKDEITDIVNISKNKRISIIYVPYLSHESYSDFKNDIYYNLTVSNNCEKIYREYEFDILPPTDDKPFYFNFDKSYNSLAFLIFYLTLFFSSFFVLLSVFSLYTKKDKLKKTMIFSYFLILGFAFMCASTVFMQKFTLLLGSPIYSFTIILFCILMFSGFGSYYSQVLNKRNISLLSILLIVSLLLFIPIFNLMFDFSVKLAFYYKVLFSVLLLFPSTFLIGIPFPTMLKIVRSRSNKDAGIMWLLDGSGSVIGSSFTLLFSGMYGFSFIFFTSIICYAVIAILIYYQKSCA